MPVVTVPCKPSGEPMAMTGSPTATLFDWPRVATVNGEWVTLMTARSVVGSRPTSLADSIVSSLKTTRMEPPAPAATETTWLLVRM